MFYNPCELTKMPVSRLQSFIHQPFESLSPIHPVEKEVQLPIKEN